MEGNVALIETQEQPISLFNSSSPAMIIEEATDIANQLADIIKSKKLYKPIGNKSHVFVEGWTTLGALLGVFPYPETSVRLDRENEIVYEATVVVRTLSGIEVSKGEAICSSKESNWRNSDEYAIKSMATTRATSKALRIPLGWIMVLAGYSATPAEEMMGKGFSQPTRTQQPAPENKRRVTPKSSLNNKPKSSTQKRTVVRVFDKPPKPETTESEPPKPEEPDNVQDAILTGPDYWKQLATENKDLKTVIDYIEKEGFDLIKVNIEESTTDLLGDVFTPEQRKNLLKFLEDKEDQ